MIDEFDNVFGTTYIYCDREGCKSQHDHDGIDSIQDIEEACEEAKEFGWIIFEEDNEWYHYCSEECKIEDELS